MKLRDLLESLDMVIEFEPDEPMLEYEVTIQTAHHEVPLNHIEQQHASKTIVLSI